MLSNIFKKSTPPAPTTPAPKQPAAPTPEQIEAQVADKAVWEGKLEAARGDDNALMVIAKESPLIDIKHAAVEALVSEEALKRAEKEFRDHDRRVHRTAKQRYEKLVARRLAAVSAAKLTETAAVLLHGATIPANRLVELDRAWSALDQTLLEEKQIADYQAHWTKLSALTRERGEQQLKVRRWLADAEPATVSLNALAAQVAEGSAERSAFSDASAAVAAILAATPDGESSTHSEQINAQVLALNSALKLLSAIDARLKLLEELHLPTVPTPPHPPTPPADSPIASAEADLAVAVAVVVEPAAADTPPAAPPVLQEITLPRPPSPTARWRAQPVVEDPAIAAKLEGRFTAWQTAKADARQAKTAEIRQHAKDETRAAKDARSEAHATLVTALVEKAETALAEGHIADATKLLTAIDETGANAKGVSVDKSLQTRIEILQSEVARLKGWQHWGGGRVRDDLVVEAEALATASAAEKLAVKQHADAIDKLRERWKELDKLGGATSRPLWQRFDTALKTAFIPVGVHLAKLKAVRQENLAARNKLLEALDAVVLAETPADGTAPPPLDWRTLTRALETFQVEWRKLGPIEHTVPHKAQAALMARSKAAVGRLEAPLDAARRIAQGEREKLIARANALLADTKGRDVVVKVRDLQTQWQAHAKSLPLARQVENAMWIQFKTATDGVFKERDAASAARDGEFKTNLNARQALIDRLSTLHADSPPTDIKRTLFEVDADWRKCGEVARADAAKIDAQYRASREAAQQHLAGSAKRGWQLVCDAFEAKIALCGEAETAASSAVVTPRWEGLPSLPAAWDKALNARLRQADTPAEIDADEALETQNALLLQLESALEIQSPAAFQASRRDLKLRAMKAAMEGRQAPATTNGDIEAWLAEAVLEAPVDASARARLATILAAIRQKPLR